MEENPIKEPQTDAEPTAEPNANEPAKNEGTPDVKKEAENAAAVPSADELAAFRKWQESQKSDAEKQAAAIGKAEKAREAAEARAAAAELKLTAISKGVTSESVEDVIALAKTKISDKVTAEQAIADILEKYPAFKAGSGTTGIKTPNNQPDTNADEAKIRRVMGLPDKK